MIQLEEWKNMEISTVPDSILWDKSGTFRIIFFPELINHSTGFHKQYTDQSQLDKWAIMITSKSSKFHSRGATG
jgi:hypothetical protein